ncbi:MAG: hypothetical protein Q8L48_31525 [Archangium sp.]|nr:hypothetical protein [Archangium sp.]
MGFLGGLFTKKPDPLDALRERVEANPKDARLAQELATQLGTKGFHARAVHYARLSAQAYRDAGFAQKALGVLKSAQAWGTPTPELLQDLADVLLALHHKEDARGTLIKLRQLHSGNVAEQNKIDARLTELGPRR